MSAAEQLLSAMCERASRRKRVPLDDVWRAFRQAVPGYAGDAEARPRLAALLGELERAGALSQPRTPKRWDRAAEPPLPQWIALQSMSQPRPRPADHRRIAWPAPMDFVSALPSVGNLDELLAIRQFFASGGDERPLVPVRERSVELFGDEKRLDALAKGALFRPGRLSLELLRCREVAPPLTFKPATRAHSKAALIVENLHTYDSFRRYNRLAHSYRAVAYGHGSEFYATVADVPRLCDELDLDTVEYFGDLDPRGLEIAAAADDWLVARGFRLSPAARWYRELLDRAETLAIPGTPRDVATRGLDWLPPALRDRAHALLTAGYRAPQELTGWEQLSKLVSSRP